MQKKAVFLGWPNFCQWKKLPKILNKNEKISFLVFLILFLSSALFLSISFYLAKTQPNPELGGKYIEGVVGQPRFINPLYASTNDIDRDLTELIFSGLVKYNEEGKIVADLAKSFDIKDDGKTYEFYLRDNIFWHDGKKLSAKDIIFTIQTIQNPDYKSPLRANWLGVGIEEINENGIRLKLTTPYAGFLENCTLKILPEHIWRDIPAENYPLTIYNLQPIGSGPFKFKNFEQDKMGYIKSYTLSSNLRYYKEGPYISEITFRYFKDEKEALNAIKNGGVQGLSFVSAGNLKEVKEKSFNIYQLLLPRYFAIFLNSQKGEIFQDKNIREAINYGTDREKIIEKALANKGEVVYSPILPEVFNLEKPKVTYKFDLEKAKELLEKAGFTDRNGDGIREKIIKKSSVFQFRSELKKGSQGTEVKELQKCLAKYPEIYPSEKITGYFGDETKEALIKFQEKYKEEILTPAGLTEGTGTTGKSTRTKLNELCGAVPEETLPLKFSLATINQPEMREIINLLKDNWLENLGIKVEIQLYDKSELEKEVIKPRNYQALLFGEVLNLVPDLFSFWHSSQKKDPGLNLSLYDNKSVDKLLEGIRQSTDRNLQKQKLEELQNILIKDSPAIFLYNPDYLYPVSKEVKGINLKIIADPSKRFSNIENWYIQTQRVWK